MKFEITSAKLLGDGSTVISQVHEFHEEEYDLFVLISVDKQSTETSSEIDSLLIVRSIAKSVQSSLVQHKELGQFASLKKAVSETISHFSNSKLQTNIGVVMFSRERVYFVASALLEVALVREGKYVSLTPQAQEVRGGSGMALPGDFFFLGSHEIGVAALASIPEQGTSVVDWAEILHSQTIEMEPEKLLGLFLQFSEHKPVTIPLEEPVVSEPPLQEPTNPTLSRAGALFSNLKRPSIRVNEQRTDFEVSKKNRHVTVAGVAILVVLVISIFWGVKTNGQKQKAQVLSSHIADVTSIVDEAKQVGPLNRARARELLTDAKTQLEEFTLDQKETAEYQSLVNEVQSSFSEIASVYSPQPETFLDLSLQSADFNAKKLVLVDDQMRVLDGASKNRVLNVNIENKRTDVLPSGNDLSSIQNIAGYGERTFVVSGDSIFELPSTKLLTIDWDTNQSLLTSFASNLYVVDQKNNAIWRYTSNDQGSFGEKQAWVAPGISFDVTDAKAWAIDGSIWILKQGKIVKFTQGLPQEVNVQGVAGSIGSANDLFTNGDTESVYILDASNSRIVVLDKKGVYLAEYDAAVFKDATAIAVSEKFKRMVILVGSKLLEVPIEHIQ